MRTVFATLLHMKQVFKKLPLPVLLTGIILGAFLVVAVRFATYKPATVHYHANFSLYVNGVRDEFKGPGYYEEVQACTNGESGDPRARVHMHDNVNNVVHVHAAGATWGHFFANLGYTLGDNVLVTSIGTYVNGQSGTLHFVLNGRVVDTAANRTIADDDAMLISYGSEDNAALQQQYASIPHNANQYDEGHDPATCSGSKPLTFTERLKKAVSVGSN